MIRRPLAHMLELGDERLGRDEFLLRQDEDRLRLDAPRIDLRLALLLRPDPRPVLEHLRPDPGDPAERLYPGDVEEDLVIGLEFLGLATASLLEADHVEAALDVDPEVLQRPGEDPAGRVVGAHGTIL